MLAVVLALSLPAVAQEASTPANQQSGSATGNSLGAAARNLKAQSAARTKKVFTEDDLDTSQSPLPPLNLYGEENTSDIVSAIVRFKQNHSAKETEDTIREWYDRYDQALANAIQENLEIDAIPSGTRTPDAWPCRSKESTAECMDRRHAEEGALDPSVRKRKNNRVIARIQQGFLTIRRGMYLNGLRYNWFKVRTSNGTDYL